MRYVLNEQFALRGWDRLPWAVVRRPDNAVQFVDKSTFRVLSLCDGTIDLELPLFDERIRTIAQELGRQGIVRALAEGERAGLTDDQRYVCHPNRCIRTAHWSITGRCNYRCKHCYMDAPDALLGELDHDTVMDIARQIVDAGILRVNLTGGEPLVRRDFLDIVDYLVDHHVVIHQIYSNGRPIAPCVCCIAAAISIGCARRRRAARRWLLRARQLDVKLKVAGSCRNTFPRKSPSWPKPRGAIASSGTGRKAAVKPPRARSGSCGSCRAPSSPAWAGPCP